jgi:hypothetical protein
MHLNLVYTTGRPSTYHRAIASSSDVGGVGSVDGVGGVGSVGSNLQDTLVRTRRASDMGTHSLHRVRLCMVYVGHSTP